MAIRSSSTLTNAAYGSSTPTSSDRNALLQKRSNYRWMMLFFALLMMFMSFMDRVNLSIATPSIIKEFHFSMVQIGMLSTAFYIPFALFQIPSGMAAERWGHRLVVTLAVVWWSVFTALTTMCTKFSSWFFVRAMFGFGESPICPGLNYAFSRWFPRQERGTASIGIVSGSCFGQIVGLPLSVIIMVHWGWRAIFIIFGAAGIICAIAYYVLLRTHPSESSFVNAAELKYIVDGQDSSGTKRGSAPWSSLLKSSQFWAIAAPAIATNFTNMVFIAWLPLYLLEARHFSLKTMGYAAALVFAGPAIGGVVGGVIADTVVRKGWGSARVRAYLGCLALLLCTGGLYLTATVTDRWATVWCLSFSLMCMGISFNSQWASAQDIGGRFAGTVSGWMQGWGQGIGGCVGPVLIAWIATHYSWRAGILLTAMICVFGATGWLFVKPDVPLKNVA